MHPVCPQGTGGVLILDATAKSPAMNFETIPKKDAFGKFECGYPKVTTENLPNADFSERPKGMARLLAVPS